MVERRAGPASSQDDQGVCHLLDEKCFKALLEIHTDFL